MYIKDSNSQLYLMYYHDYKRTLPWQASPEFFLNFISLKMESTESSLMKIIIYTGHVPVSCDIDPAIRSMLLAINSSMTGIFFHMDQSQMLTKKEDISNTNLMCSWYFTAEFLI